MSIVWGQSNYATPYTFITIAGVTSLNGGSSDGTNGAALFDGPSGIAVDNAGNLYVADTFNDTIRKITPVGTNWVTTTIAGTAGDAGSRDGTNTAAQFSSPTSIAIDTNGNLYVTDTDNQTIRKITPVGANWVVSTIAGSVGDNSYADGTNDAAKFSYPYGIAVGTNGDLYVSDQNNEAIRQIAPVGTNWVVTTIAGTVPDSGSADGIGANASFYGPSGIAVDARNNLYVVDTDNDTIRKLTPSGTDWVVTTIAGSVGNPGSDDGTNLAAQFNYPFGITVDHAGNLYVADASNDTIRKLTPLGTNWVTTTLAGVADESFSADGTGTNALFNYPNGIAVDHAGNLYVTDADNNTIRMGSAAVVSSTPGLTIRFVAPDSLVISWPDTGEYTLQSNSSLSSPNWVDYTGPVTTSNGTNTVTITPYDGNQFFRLRNGSVVTTTAPVLTVKMTPPNNLVISWPDTGSYTLQSNGDLKSANWVDYGGTVTTSNGTNSVTVTTTSGSLFFRLTN